MVTANLRIGREYQLKFDREQTTPNYAGDTTRGISIVPARYLGDTRKEASVFQEELPNPRVASIYHASRKSIAKEKKNLTSRDGFVHRRIVLSLLSDGELARLLRVSS